MKHKLLLLSLILLGFNSIALAQKTHQQRKALREQRQEQFTENLKKAFETRNFTFMAFQMQTNFSPITSVMGIDNYIDVYPNDLDIDLPYMSTAFEPDMEQLYFTTISYTYQVQYSPTDKMAYLDIVARNTVDLNEKQGVAVDGDTLDNINYTIRMQVSMLSGATTVTITPTFGNQMQYIGTLQLNN